VSLTLDAHVPDGAGPFPTVIIVHGGGFIAGNKQTYVPPLFEPLSKGGFTWFTINYRLAPQSCLFYGPHDFVSRNMPPYLLIHSATDKSVPYDRSNSMCEKMQKAGASCEVFTVEGAPHGVGRHPLTDFLQRVFQPRRVVG
jgi:acetyl esterase/lipase